MKKEKIRFVVALLAVMVLAAVSLPAQAEVRLFVDRVTVRVDDPTLGQPSILNDFYPKGHRTHNNLALVWNETSVWVYDIRVHQWMSLDGFAPLAGMLSDELALAWEPGRVAVYDSRDRRWVTSEALPGRVKSPLLSRKMAAVTCEEGFVVYDPLLKAWQTAGDFAVQEAQLGDNLAVAWDGRDAVIYDTTVRQWVVKEGIAPQAAIVEPYAVSIYSAEKIYTYDAMTHRWGETPR
ncbi:MAG: hypothetical protein PHF19_01855 [Synergistales bacterium]|jgi:hypothetical protein|nr:hypothetical protein [Synergistales bacterium]